jgi:hypothetical protein
MNQQLLLLAIDPGGVIFLIFAFVSFVSWLVNQLNGAKGKPQPRPQNRPGPRAQNPQIQREIDRFLREAAGQKPRPEVKGNEIEIVQAPQGRRPPAARKVVERPRPAAPRPAAVRPAAPARPGQELASRHLATAGPSAVAREHLESRVAAEHLPRDVARSVSAHLGVFAAVQSPAGQAAERQRAASAELIAALRSKQGIRSAIIMQEILKRPRALRRGSE